MLDLPELREAAIAGGAALVIVLLAAFALGRWRHGMLLGLAAAFGAYAITQALWALSTPHSPWINLIFQLFPAPVIYASARLIALYAALGMGVRAPSFALGFALFEA